jgi:hypothetical protein
MEGQRSRLMSAGRRRWLLSGVGLVCLLAAFAIIVQSRAPSAIWRIASAPGDDRVIPVASLTAGGAEVPSPWSVFIPAPDEGVLHLHRPNGFGPPRLRDALSTVWPSLNGTTCVKYRRSGRVEAVAGGSWIEYQRADDASDE